MLIGASHNPNWGRYGRLRATWKSWVGRRGFHRSVTFGFGKIFTPAAADDSIVAAHEEIHSEQIEDLMMLSLIIGSAVGFIGWNGWIGLGVYLSGGAWQLPNYLTAKLRGGRPLHERHAYAEEDEVTPIQPAL
jgi:hypothetical protein